MSKPNWFPTLSEALEAEGIGHMWDGRHIPYRTTISCTFQDGTKYGHYVSVYRNEIGMYERPVHYSRN